MKPPFYEATDDEQPPKAAPQLAFAGRLGGNQRFLVDPDNDPDRILQKVPDAALGMSLSDQFSLQGFGQVQLWKAATAEGVASLLLTFMTMWANISPSGLPVMPERQFGYFANAAYLGPTTAGVQNFILLSLFTFAFGVSTGAHINPTITLATFFARMTSLPRLVLYVTFQIAGAAVAGILVRESYGTRAFKVGGCWLYTEYIPVRSALLIEFVASMGVLFLAFGVGLDPRQQKVISPGTSPFLVGLATGVLTWVFGYTRYGYGGASMNPARCFGVGVGSGFSSWHWHYWIASILACAAHGVFYYFNPPVSTART